MELRSHGMESGVLVGSRCGIGPEGPLLCRRDATGTLIRELDSLMRSNAVTGRVVLTNQPALAMWKSRPVTPLKPTYSQQTMLPSFLPVISREVVVGGTSKYWNSGNFAKVSVSLCIFGERQRRNGAGMQKFLDHATGRVAQENGKTPQMVFWNGKAGEIAIIWAKLQWKSCVFRTIAVAIACFAPSSANLCAQAV